MFRFCLPTQLNQLHRENGLDVFVLPLRKRHAKYLYSGLCFRDKFMFSFASSISYQFKNAVCNLSTIIRFRNLIVVFVVFCMYLFFFFLLGALCETRAFGQQLRSCTVYEVARFPCSSFAWSSSQLRCRTSAIQSNYRILGEYPTLVRTLNTAGNRCLLESFPQVEE